MSWISIFSWGLVQTTLRASTPIIFAALAAVLTQNAGILNVGIEGGMLISALTAVCANAATGSWVVGVLASIAAAELYSLVIAVAHLRFKANVFAVGSILNIMAASLTGFILNTAYGVSGRLVPDTLVSVNDMSVLGYVGIVCVLLLGFLLYKTVWGLRVRSAGLYSAAALTSGFDPVRKKFEAIMISGILVGIGGAYMSTSYVEMFVEGMISGRGFMGIAAMFFGGANPFVSTVGCLIFGLAYSVGAKLQYMGIPTQFVQIIPYLVTVVIYSVSMYSFIRKAKKEKKSTVLQK